MLKEVLCEMVCRAAWFFLGVVHWVAVVKLDDGSQGAGNFIVEIFYSLFGEGRNQFVLVVSF